MTKKTTTNLIAKWLNQELDYPTFRKMTDWLEESGVSEDERTKWFKRFDKEY